MNNTIIIIIAVVVVAGGGAFLFLNGNSNSTDAISSTAIQTNKETVKEEPSDDIQESFTGNIEQLLALGKNITCTFTQNDEQAEGTGTVYLSNGRMRGDFMMNFKQGGGSMEASTIQKDNTLYSWGDSPFGTFATKVAVQDKDKSSKSQSVDFDEEFDYACKKWNVDNSMFDLPATVNFDDINAEVNQINQATSDILDLQCSACDNIPDANAKAQCQAALGC
ncbi:hypothetical protein N8083_00600 [Candidatus Pacebacteria bacterium]|nr:hypothetical protein [Candidatus Paceibacterota bacterium]